MIPNFVVWLLVGFLIFQFIVIGVFVVPWKRYLMERWGNSALRCRVYLEVDDEVPAFDGWLSYSGCIGAVYCFEYPRGNVLSIFWPDSYRRTYIDGRLRIRARLGHCLALPESEADLIKITGEAKDSIEFTDKLLQGIDWIDSEVVYTLDAEGNKLVPIADAPADLIATLERERVIESATMAVQGGGFSINWKKVLIALVIIGVVVAIGIKILPTFMSKTIVTPETVKQAPIEQVLTPKEVVVK